MLKFNLIIMAILDQQNTSNNGTLSMSTGASNVYHSTGFTVSNDGDVSQVDIYIKKNGNGGGNYSIEIWSDNGSNLPNAKISDTQTITSSGVGTSLEWKSYTFSSPPSLNSGDKAHIVIYRLATDSSNNIGWGYSTGAAYAGPDRCFDSDAASWTQVADQDHNFKQYYDAAGGTAKDALLLGVG
jgi:hypothetical protein